MRATIAPYLSGSEIETPSAVPLGLIQDQTYDMTRGHLTSGERLVLLSDGFDRVSSLTLMAAQDIAEAAQRFGQEDDITVMTLALATSEPRTGDEW